jgi:anti-anti-sigma regulatory factor
MPIRTLENMVFLDSHCPIEEAESLFETLRQIEDPVFDLSHATYIHSAIVQLIIASRGTVRGLAPDIVLSACFVGQISP